MQEETLFMLLVVGGALLVPAAYVIGTYNRLVGLRNRIRESWADVDTELKRRYDLIPNLVECVKGYATHEKDVMERVIQARNQAAQMHARPSDQARDENQFVQALNRLLVVAEAYPDLKASKNFLQLQDELVNTEDRIQASRRFFNANVRDNNNAVQTFPSNVIASMFSFSESDYYEIDAAARAVPNARVFDGKPRGEGDS